MNAKTLSSSLATVEEEEIYFDEDGREEEKNDDMFDNDEVDYDEEWI